MQATQVSDRTSQRSGGLARSATAMRWIALALAVVALLLLVRILPLERLVDVLRGWIEGLGVWGPVALGLIYVIATVLMIPGWILTVAAGALFGLLWGTIVVSLGSTAGAALAFLIARYFARDRAAQQFDRYPKFRAVDRAIGEGGWKIVALLRLSPAIPFNLQNYLYGLTPIRFWPYVIASWAAMLPGTFLYIYLGWLGGAGLEAAAGDRTAGAGVWILRGVGLLATVVVIVYFTRLARRALKQQADIDEGDIATPEKRGTR